MERPTKKRRIDEGEKQALAQLRDMEVVPQLFSTVYRDLIRRLLMFLPAPSIESSCSAQRAVRQQCDMSTWTAVRMADFPRDVAPNDNRLPGGQTHAAYAEQLRRVDPTEQGLREGIKFQKQEYRRQMVASRFNIRHGSPVRLYAAWMTAADQEFNLDWWERTETVDVSVDAVNVMPVGRVRPHEQPDADLARRYGPQSAWVFELEERFEGTHFRIDADRIETYRIVIFATRVASRQVPISKREIYELVELPATRWDIVQEFWPDTGTIPSEKNTLSTSLNYTAGYAVDMDVLTADSVDVLRWPEGVIWAIMPTKIYWSDVEAVKADAYRLFMNTPGRLALRFESGQPEPEAITTTTIGGELDTGQDIQLLEQDLCWHALEAQLLGTSISLAETVYVINVKPASDDDDDEAFLFDATQNRRHCRHSFTKEALVRWLQYEKTPEQTRLCPRCP